MYRVEISSSSDAGWSVMAAARDRVAALRWLRDAVRANPGARVRVLDPAGDVIMVEPAVRQ